ncbi:hypothetical protein PRIPAC_72805 [Pristionchus pacificus]|uniref:Uncharacterized protein n=1 Tax=Pristionchus pacificus TaxID=54126 RepID=A0A2A6CA54_PRIPA|nr:hypothetical protein PRIPAC_72805 [Pristionchus pacificus]|eukprot:PDM74958.1 hypothetical protein PRIPAC_40339 [Pristionchus pacificus]
MNLEEYVESLPQDQLPPDGKIHPTRKKLPPSDAVKYIPKEKSVGGLVNFEEEKQKKRRQELEAKLAVSETNNDVSESKLSRRSKENNERKRGELKMQKEMEEKGIHDKSKMSQSSSGEKKDKKDKNEKKEKKNDVDEDEKYKLEMERRLEKKTIIDKVTFFDKETKRDDFPETSQDEKIGQDRDSMKKKVLIILGILFILVIIALTEGVLPIPQCPRNMEYRVIGDLCEPTCGVIEPSCQVQEIVLWPFELSKCQCKIGFYRLVLTGPCVPLSQCKSIVGENAVPKKRVPRAALPYKENQRINQLPKRQMNKLNMRKTKKQSGMTPAEAKSKMFERAVIRPFASLIYGPLRSFAIKFPCDSLNGII